MTLVGLNSRLTLLVIALFFSNLAQADQEEDRKALWKLVADSVYWPNDPAIVEGKNSMPRMEAALLLHPETVRMLLKDPSIVERVALDLGQENFRLPVYFGEVTRALFSACNLVDLNTGLEHVPGIALGAVSVNVDNLDIENCIVKVPRAVYVALDANIDDAVAQYDFTQIKEQLDLLLSPIPDSDKFGALAKIALPGYFLGLPVKYKRLIISLVLKSSRPSVFGPAPSDHDIAKLFLAVVRGTGPFFQKLVQQASGRIELSTPLPGMTAERTREVAAALEKAKNKLSIIPDYVTERNIAEISEKSQGNTRLVVNKILGRASIANAYLATIYRKDRKINPIHRLPLLYKLAEGGGGSWSAVFKQVRPGLAEYFAWEKSYIGPLAASVQLGGTFEIMAEDIVDEMDLSLESQNLRTGVERYNNDKDSIVAVEPVSLPPSKNYMAMKLAPGFSLKATLENKDLIAGQPYLFPNVLGEEYAGERNLKKISFAIESQMLNQLLRKWVEVAFFQDIRKKGGVFHADLHSGNIFTWVDTAFYAEWFASKKGIVDLTQNIELDGAFFKHVMSNQDKQQLTLIDFGRFIKMPFHEAEAMINLAASAITKSGEAFTDALMILDPKLGKRFSGEGAQARKNFQADVQAAMNGQKKGGDPLKVLEAVGLIMLREGMDAPSSMTNFLQTLNTLELNFKKLKEKIVEFGFGDEEFAKQLDFGNSMRAVLEPWLIYNTSAKWGPPALLAVATVAMPLFAIYTIPAAIAWQSLYKNGPAINAANLKAYVTGN